MEMARISIWAMNIQTNGREGWIIREMEFALTPPPPSWEIQISDIVSGSRRKLLMKFFLGFSRRNISGYKYSWIFHYLVHGTLVSLSWAKKKVNIAVDVTDKRGKSGYPRRRRTEDFQFISRQLLSLPAVLWRVRKTSFIDWFTLGGGAGVFRDEIMLFLVLDVPP